jgi:hypothetical protein
MWDVGWQGGAPEVAPVGPDGGPPEGDKRTRYYRSGHLSAGAASVVTPSDPPAA